MLSTIVNNVYTKVSATQTYAYAITVLDIRTYIRTYTTQELKTQQRGTMYTHSKVLNGIIFCCTHSHTLCSYYTTQLQISLGILRPNLPSLTSPSSVSKMLAPLISRWILFWVCRYARPCSTQVGAIVSRRATVQQTRTHPCKSFKYC